MSRPCYCTEAQTTCHICLLAAERAFVREPTCGTCKHYGHAERYPNHTACRHPKRVGLKLVDAWCYPTDCPGHEPKESAKP